MLNLVFTFSTPSSLLRWCRGGIDLACLVALSCILGCPGITSAGDLAICHEVALRDAVATGGTFSITASCGSIQLTQPLIVEKDTTFTTTTSFTLTAATLFPLFIIKPGVTLSITRLNLGGYKPFSQNEPYNPIYVGRAIYNDGGTFLAESCSFRGALGTGGPDAGMGGAIFSRNGSIRLQKCALEYNSAAAAGGSIYATNSTVTLTQCALRTNSAGGSPNSSGLALGGALCLDRSLSTLTGCELTGNAVACSVSNVFRAFGGSIAQLHGELTLTTTTLALNRAEGANDFRQPSAEEVKGGAVYSSGTLVVSGSTFTNNYCRAGIDANLTGSAIGGAIYCSATLQLLSSRLAYNTSSGANARGGALANEGNAALNGNLFASNICKEARRESQGGAIHNSGVLTLSSATFISNEAVVSQASHLFPAVEASGPILNSDLGGAIASGGGIHNSGTCSATNSTFRDNRVYARTTADSSLVPASARGGAVFNARGTFTLVHATIATNRCERDYFDERTSIQGAGIFHASGTTLLINSAVANNSPGGNCFGTLADGGGNACSDESCPFVTGYVNQPIEFQAAPGPSSTLIPMPGSVLIDGAIGSACTPQDQLGRARPIGSACDIGAVESLSTGNTQWTRFRKPKPRVLESSEEIVITVQHVGNVTGTFRVNYETRDGTATAGTDYAAARGELVFSSGITLASFSVKFRPDALPEPNETIQLILTDPTTGAILAEEELTIVEEETKFRFARTQFEGYEGNSLSIEVIREGSTGETAAVNFHTVDGTAQAGHDYLPIQGTLIFAPGETQRTLNIQTLEDDERESTETVGIGLTLPLRDLEIGRTVAAVRDVTDCDLKWLQAAVERGGLIRFECDHTYVLPKTLVITRDTIFDATGHDVILDGNRAVRLIEVRPGVTLSLTNLTLMRGRQLGRLGVQGGQGGDAYGAAIFNDQGTVHAFQCRFAMNSVQGGDGGVSTRDDQPIPGGAAFGAALFSQSGTLSLVQCEFSTNRAAGGVGGYGPLMPEPAPGGSAQGGGLYGTNTTLQLQGCRFEGNTCLGGRGGERSGTFLLSNFGSSRGGAVYTIDGNAVITEATLVQNRSLSGAPATGGAIHQEGGTLMLRRASIEKNSAEGADTISRYGLGSSSIGGGIFSHGQLLLSECQFLGNTSFSRGVDSAAGGVYSSAGASIDGCYFESNRSFTMSMGRICGTDCRGARYGLTYGGALFNTNTLVLINSSFVGNIAEGGVFEQAWDLRAFGTNAFGGGLANYGVCYTTNNTFVLNAARGGPMNGGDGFGGGICNLSGELFLNHATFFQNQVSGAEASELTGALPGNGFGSQLFNGAGRVTLANSILADTKPSTNCVGTILDAGGNLSSDLSCQFTSGFNGLNPRLAPLARYGGTVPLLALLPGSPAIDAGDGHLCAPADQRGFPRPSGAQCDIGAFEAHGELAAESLFQEWADESHLRLIYVGATGSTRRLESSPDLDLWTPWGPDFSLGDQGWFQTDVPVQSQDSLRAFRVQVP
ncbi:MAG: hypothetical protein JNN07_04880 [Verrucomicrobiales bacterium]|nr:hypothetical protein [Verrucomicrobiales bacterium]